jgi:tryptophan-rich sensory protein
MARGNVLAGIGFAAATYGVAAIGNLTMRGRGAPDRMWFRSLRKPRWQPPNWVFGPVWTALYAAIAYAGWRIWRAPKSRRRTTALGLWSAQLVLNGLWTPIFFGARRPIIALADIVALDAAATGCAIISAGVDKRAAAAFVPYLGWLGFATVLNARIVATNPTR